MSYRSNKKRNRPSLSDIKFVDPSTVSTPLPSNLRSNSSVYQTGTNPLNNNNPIELGNIVPNKQPTFEPFYEPVVEQPRVPFLQEQPQQYQPQQLSQEDKFQNTLSDQIGRYEEELRTLEDKIFSPTGRQDQAYESYGIYDDLKKRAELKNKLITSQDREVEIPLEERAKLSGKGATRVELAQRTQPLSEKASLETLANSRAYSRFSEVSLANQQIVDTRLKAENEMLSIEYNRKNDRLDRVLQMHSDIVSNKQKKEMEELKQKNALELDERQSSNDLRLKLAERLGKVGGTAQEFQTIESGSSSDMYKAYANAFSRQTASEARDEVDLKLKRLELGGKQIDFDLLNPNSVQYLEKQKQKANAFGIEADNLIDIIDNKQRGLKGVSGIVQGFGDNFVSNAITQTFNPQRGEVLMEFGNIFSRDTIGVLKKLKEETGAVGQTSEREWPIYRASIAPLVAGARFDDYNNFIGFNKEISEKAIREGVQALTEIKMKSYLKETMSPSEFTNAERITGYNEVKAIYDRQKDLNSGKEQIPDAENWIKDIGNSVSGIFIDNSLNKTYSLLREEEGFRESAYQDTTGTWTIGYGTTRINGRPVQRGDSLNTQQAQSVMQEQIVNNYTNWIDKLNVDISPNMFAALTSFEYNLGGAIWDGDARPIIEKLNRGDIAGASNEILAFNRAYNPKTGTKTVHPVLTKRRQRESNLLLT